MCATVYGKHLISGVEYALSRHVNKPWEEAVGNGVGYNPWVRSVDSCVTRICLLARPSDWLPKGQNREEITGGQKCPPLFPR